MPMLKMVAVIAVMLLAGVGCLFVLDIIPRDVMEEFAVKAVLVAGILAAAGFVLGLLLRKDAAG